MPRVLRPDAGPRRDAHGAGARRSARLDHPYDLPMAASRGLRCRRKCRPGRNDGRGQCSGDSASDLCRGGIVPRCRRDRRVRLQLCLLAVGVRLSPEVPRAGRKHATSVVVSCSNPRHRVAVALLQVGFTPCGSRNGGLHIPLDIMVREARGSSMLSVAKWTLLFISMAATLAISFTPQWFLSSAVSRARLVSVRRLRRGLPVHAPVSDSVMTEESARRLDALDGVIASPSGVIDGQTISSALLALAAAGIPPILQIILD